MLSEFDTTYTINDIVDMNEALDFKFQCENDEARSMASEKGIE